MILYHAVSTYQMLEFIVHKSIKEKYSEAAILISDDIPSRYPSYEYMLSQYFHTILVYSNSLSVRIMFKENDFDSYFHNIFLDAGLNITDIERIYVSCCHAGFGTYLCRHNIPFIYFEDAAGALSTVQGCMEHVRKTNPQRNEELLLLGLYDGSSSLVIKRMYNMSANLNIAKADTDEDFNLAFELKSLDVEIRDKIIKTFINMDPIHIPEKSALIMTEHLYNLNLMTWEAQCFMYQTVIDYFLQDYHLVFKTHPDDLLYYEQLFPNSDIIIQKFPSELLPYIFAEMPECIATISSTSIFGLQNIFAKKLMFNQTFSYFEHQYWDLHRYYMALQYAQPYLEKNYELHLCGVNTVIIDNFNEYGHVKCSKYIFHDSLQALASEDITKSAVYLIDKLGQQSFDCCKWLEKRKSKDLVIFLNTDETYCFYHIDYKKLWQSIYPICIKKNRLRENHIYQTMEHEIFYLFQKEHDMQKQQIEKIMEYSGIGLKAEEYTEEKLRIMVLEGMLDAAEKRLQYYMKKCEEADL